MEPEMFKLLFITVVAKPFLPNSLHELILRLTKVFMMLKHLVYYCGAVSKCVYNSSGLFRVYCCKVRVFNLYFPININIKGKPGKVKW